MRRLAPALLLAVLALVVAAGVAYADPASPTPPPRHRRYLTQAPPRRSRDREGSVLTRPRRYQRAPRSSAAIKRHGGRVLAQDPATARAGRMPSSAIATGCVDFVLPLRRLRPDGPDHSAGRSRAAHRGNPTLGQPLISRAGGARGRNCR